MKSPANTICLSSFNNATETAYNNPQNVTYQHVKLVTYLMYQVTESWNFHSSGYEVHNLLDYMAPHSPAKT